jgi:hypothetical protein
LSTLAVPETCTGELIAVLASGLSMMIFTLGSAIGVTAVAGRVEGAGVAPGLADALVLGLAEALGAGVPVSSTNVVVLSPPHAANARHAVPTTSAAPNLFMTPLNARRPQSVTATGRLGAL